MLKKTYACCIVATIALTAFGFGQNTAVKVRGGRLTLVQQKELKSEMAGIFALPLKCDADGKLYVRTGDDAAIAKIDPKRDTRETTFPQGPLPKEIRRLRYFDISGDGTIRQLASLSQSADRYFVKFSADGTYQSTVKLRIGFGWLPAQIASFPSGRVLVTGQRSMEDGKKDEHTRQPFTGIFGEDGRLITEVKLADDERLHQLAESGDPIYVSSQVPDSNRAITHGAAESGPDGNVYLMRAASPPIIYAIAADGNVVRRFTVDPGKEGFVPLQPLHISGSRIAVLFHNDRAEKQRVKVVSPSGEELASYDTAEGHDSLGPTLACYSESHEQFTFLMETADGHYLTLRAFEPR